MEIGGVLVEIFPFLHPLLPAILDSRHEGSSEGSMRDTSAEIVVFMQDRRLDEGYEGHLKYFFNIFISSYFFFLQN